MALVRVYGSEFTALSTDIVDDKIETLKTIGAKVYITDTKVWKITNDDLTLSDYIINSDSEIATFQLGTVSKNAINLVTIDTTANGTIIVNENLNRLSISIQNQGTVPVLLSFGENTSITNYNMILAGGSSVRYADGGTFYDTIWKGYIKGLTETESSVVSILEQIGS